MTTAEIESISKLSKDILQSTQNIGRNEARYLVNAYYDVQEYRKAARNQRLQLQASGQPDAMITWIGDQMETLEREIAKGLKWWASSEPIGQWAMSITGIGPVIAAGLMAHIDITKAPTAGHIWRFAGYDPTSQWNKGQKRPWNADLKVLCWKIGESFVKFKGLDSDVYGKVYEQRKQFETAANARGEYREQALKAAERVKRTTEAYNHYIEGKLPPGHIHARAKRYAVKLFLSHYQHVAHELEYGVPPALPVILNQPEHVHFIAPPNLEIIRNVKAQANK